MTRAKILLAVEGQHDAAFIGRFLKERHDLPLCRSRPEVDPFWEPTIPTSFPHKDDLKRPVPVPSFYQNTSCSVAILDAEGETNLKDEVCDTLDILSGPVDAVGVFVDADGVSPQGRFDRFVAGFKEQRGLRFGQGPGSVGNGAPRCGVFVFPDNRTPGTLEELLLACAESSYPGLLEAARRYIAAVEPTMFVGREVREFNRPSGRAKSTVATLAAVLKPGKSIQASLTDNRWITADTLALPRIAAVAEFVGALLAPLLGAGEDRTRPLA